MFCEFFINCCNLFIWALVFLSVLMFHLYVSRDLLLIILIYLT